MWFFFSSNYEFLQFQSASNLVTSVRYMDSLPYLDHCHILSTQVLQKKYMSLCYIDIDFQVICVTYSVVSSKEAIIWICCHGLVVCNYMTKAVSSRYTLLFLLEAQTQYKMLYVTMWLDPWPLWLACWCKWETVVAKMQLFGLVT